MSRVAMGLLPQPAREIVDFPLPGRGKPEPHDMGAAFVLFRHGR